MENWRGYLQEQDPQEEKPKQGCVTVGSLKVTINDLQKAEERGEDIARLKGWVTKLAKNIVGYIPAIGPAIEDAWEAKDILIQIKSEVQKKGIDYDTVADYPILGQLKIDPELIKVIEDDILKALDEMYEQEILSTVNDGTCIDKIPNINDFIRSKIAVETDKSVVIQDLSGKKSK